MDWLDFADGAEVDQLVAEAERPLLERIEGLKLRNAYLENALQELWLRTRQFLDGKLVTFPAALLPQVEALLEDR